MAVFRVEKTKGYTVMSNHHLRNADLTLKAKGLLSQMLSLPENWDYTLKGLSIINREKIDAIRTAVWELEAAGYIVRQQKRDNKGKMAAIEYTIYEQPQATPEQEQPILENPTSDNPTSDNPTPDNSVSENPLSENPTQINKEVTNTDLLKKEKLNIDAASTDSIPILSPLTPHERGEWNGTEQNSAVQAYREIILDNIEYDIICDRFNKDRLDEIVDLILETVCTSRKTIRVAGDDYPAEFVKSKFLKLNSMHIEFVFDCMKQNTTKIRNIKKYMLAVLFNAPSTIDNYYSALVNHDMYGGDFEIP